MTKRECFSGNFLKCVAAFCMVCDHIGVLIFPMNIYPEWAFLRYIGRIAFPIFAYFIAEGCFYTKNKTKYLGQMVLFGVTFNVVYAFFTGDRSYANIFVSFSLAICFIYCLQGLFFHSLPGKIAFWTAFVLFLTFTYFVCQKIHIDYGFFGILLPVFTYCGQTKKKKLLFFSFGLILIALDMKSSFFIQIWSLLSLVPLVFYNGERGKIKMKYFFYVFYPAHLVLILLIALLVGRISI